MDLRLFPQHLSFLVTYEWAQYARVFDHSVLERLAKDKPSTLKGSFLSYEENKVL